MHTHVRAPFIINKAPLLACIIIFGSLFLSSHAFVLQCDYRPGTALLLSSKDPGHGTYLHHTAIKTRNIETCIQFYSLLGFEVETKFRAGPARAAWLACPGGGARLEVMEIPGYILNEPAGTIRRALDLTQQPQLLGLNHMALDVTATLEECRLEELDDWLNLVNEASVQTFGKTLRIAVPTRQQIIGNGVYQLAFLYDADGALVELIHKQAELEQPMADGWEPWDADGVVLNFDLDLMDSRE
jgi:catechol 2,3-dioxygenase-like lactoylglutathione lyase family enzyme